MFCFPSMFYPYIKDSKLKTPPEDQWELMREKVNNVWTYDDYPHFTVFMNSHLSQPIWSDLLEANANIIADIPLEELNGITWGQLIEKGVVYNETGYIE